MSAELWLQCASILSFNVPGGCLSGSLPSHSFPLSSRPLGVFLPSFFLSHLCPWCHQKDMGREVKCCTLVPSQEDSPQVAVEKGLVHHDPSRSCFLWLIHLSNCKLPPSSNPEVQAHTAFPKNYEVGKENQQPYRSSWWCNFLAWFLISFWVRMFKSDDGCCTKL